MSTEIEESVINKIRLRRDAGRLKYGVSMERDDLDFYDWISHLQEELLDAAIYAEKMIQAEALKCRLDGPPKLPKGKVKAFQEWRKDQGKEPNSISNDTAATLREHIDFHEKQAKRLTDTFAEQQKKQSKWCDFCKTWTGHSILNCPEC